VDLGVHLPLLADDHARVRAVAEAARDLGFAALAANDHLVFGRPWIDGPTALASVISSSGAMTLATTAALPVIRGPVALAKALTAIDALSGGRLIAAVGPGSSRADYEAVGIPFEERWARFDAALEYLRPRIRPLWVASWGSPAGLRRAARADGWLASAYNTTPPRFAAALATLEAAKTRVTSSPADGPGAGAVAAADGPGAGGAGTVDGPGAGGAATVDGPGAGGAGTVDGPGAGGAATVDGPGAGGAAAAGGAHTNALATMWTWVGDDGERVLRDVLAPLVGRDVDELRDRVCVGTPEHCARLLAGYAAAGCQRVYLWPLADEERQLERIAGEVAPAAQVRLSSIAPTGGPA
jgi:alkanesulfonate monooxygenase SsuD/methylene tetrahydromethanopterin reductase-like flavin-dependent oxidoreductase (luciferase family)